MRNSWAPLLGLAVAAVIAFLLLEPSSPAGGDGPVLLSGVYHAKEPFPGAVPVERLTVAVTIEPTEDLLAFSPPVDRRVGLEVVPWDQIALLVDDHAPMTRSVAESLAEHLTGELARRGLPSPVSGAEAGRLVHFVLREDDGLPMAMRRLLSLRLESADGEAGPGSSGWNGQLIASLRDAHRPAFAETSDLLPADGIREGSWRIRISASASADCTWLQWHVGIARAAAAALIREMRGPLSQAELAWDSPNDTARRLLARTTSGFLKPDWPQYAGFTWQAVVDVPPREGVERWVAAVQAPLVRGWVGQILGVEVTRKGEILDTGELFRQRIGKSAKLWVETMAEGEDRWWDGTVIGKFDHLYLLRRGYGYEVGVFKALAEPHRTMQLWLDLAEDGEDLARHQLRRHLRCTGLPQPVLADAAAWLRRDPDAADQAALALLPDASATERQVATCVAWLRGIVETVPDVTGLPRLGTEPVSWDGRPRLFVQDERLILLVRHAEGAWACYHRASGEPPIWTVHGSSEHSCSLVAPWRLVIDHTAEGHHHVRLLAESP